MARKLRVKCSSCSLLTIDRSNMWRKGFVYVLVANKRFKYHSGRRTHVIYIGTTGKGAHRAAASATQKAAEMFGEIRGLKQIGVYVVNCRRRRNVSTWRELESALLGAFRNLYYELPKQNKRNERATNPERYFNERNLRAFLLSLEAPKLPL